MGDPWFRISKEEAPPIVIDRASETGLWGERNPAP